MKSASLPEPSIASFRRWVLLALGFSLCGELLLTCEEAEAGRNPSNAELRALFEVTTRPLPEKMVLSAEIEVREPAMDSGELEERISREIAEALAFERNLAERAGGIVSESDLDSLGSAIAEEMRKRFSGERKLRRKEWYSQFGRLYRIDWFDYISLDSDPVLRTNILSGGIPTLFSEISLGIPAVSTDPRFPKGRGISINHGIQSASVHKEGDFEVDEPELWQALSVRGELAFPIGVLLAVADSIPDDSPFRDMMIGAKLDLAKLDQAVSGSVLGWDLVASDEVFGERRATRITLSGNPGSLFNEILDALVKETPDAGIKAELKNSALAVYSYWVDDGDDLPEPRLIKVQKLIPGNRLLISTREWDERTGQLLSWKTSDRNLTNGNESNVNYSFSDMDLAADFSDEQVFGYGQLAGLDYVDYGNRLVQHPEGVKILNPPPGGDAIADWVKKLILFLVVLLPVFFLRRVIGLSSHKTT